MLYVCMYVGNTWYVCICAYECMYVCLCVCWYVSDLKWSTVGVVIYAGIIYIYVCKLGTVKIYYKF